ncbi:MAG: sugar phosphate isomerase/epimerase [Anaerolineae bacterium]|nr:sugar phosphate isomerase/epimerase [Anaerolineae bacterium]
MKSSIWTAMYAELSLPNALNVLNAHGWTTFEMSTEHFVEIASADNPDDIIERTMACLESLELAMPQGHAYLQARVADIDAERRQRDIAVLRKHLDIADRLGVEVVVMHPGGDRAYTTREDWQRIVACNVEAFQQLGDYAGERGIKIGLENLNRRGAATPDDMWDLLTAIDHPACGFTLDTSHAHLADLDIAAAIMEFSPRLFATHISDNDHSGDQHLTPGGGQIDWIKVMTTFSETSYTGLFNLEIPGERHPVLQLRELKSRHALDVCNWLLSLV